MKKMIPHQLLRLNGFPILDGFEYLPVFFDRCGHLPGNRHGLKAGTSDIVHEGTGELYQTIIFTQRDDERVKFQIIGMEQGYFTGGFHLVHKSLNTLELSI